MLFIILCLFVLIYTVFSTILVRTFGVKIVKHIDNKDAIALTFDDGPNPIYTPILLDLLKKYHVRASFFVVGKKVEEHPKIIKRMNDEGHTIGIHNYTHVSNWILTPFGIRKQLKRSKESIQQSIGKPPVFYRPPWGHFNLSTLFVSNKFKVIMWSHILGDWRIKNCGTKLLNRLRQARTEEGAIIVLHDSGDNIGADNEAPSYMLKSLEIFLKESQELGTKFVTLDETFKNKTRGHHEQPSDHSLH
jgi:peptidoglycan/xylan/chitin deacetylase (PgdA/CDA1 family)